MVNTMKKLMHKSVRWIFMSALACWMISVPFIVNADPVYVPPSTTAAPLGGAQVTGQVTSYTGTAAQLALRNGKSITVDLNTAQKNHLAVPIYVDEFLLVQGSLSGGLMTAVSVSRAKSNPNAWMPDVP